MARLIPALTKFISVHPSTAGSDIQRLVVEKHSFPAAEPPAKSKVAFVWSHANGFHKEILHPLMRRTLTQFRTLSRFHRTDFDFYAWDSRNHGDSARLNDGHVHIPTCNERIICSSKNGANVLIDTWVDNALDTIQVVDEMGLKENYDKLIGVGHSFGGSSMYVYRKDFAPR